MARIFRERGWMLPPATCGVPVATAKRGQRLGSADGETSASACRLQRERPYSKRPLERTHRRFPMRFFRTLLAVTLGFGFSLAAHAGGQDETISKLTPVIGLLHGANQAEIEDATLAIQKIKAGAAKDFAQMLRDDHTASDRDLKPIVEGLGVTLCGLEALGDDGVAMMNAHREFLRAAATQSEQEFVVAFLRHERDDHQKVIAKLTTLRAALPENADTARLVSFVDATLPKLQEHERRAEMLLAQVGG
jgi:predicted outer membrane protein